MKKNFYRIIVLTLLVAFCMLIAMEIPLLATDIEIHECREHGSIEAVVTIIYLDEEYQLCGECVLEFISNNSKAFSSIVRKAKR